MGQTFVKHSKLTLLISFATGISEAPKLIQVDGFCVQLLRLYSFHFTKLGLFFFPCQITTYKTLNVFLSVIQ